MKVGGWGRGWALLALLGCDDGGTLPPTADGGPLDAATAPDGGRPVDAAPASDARVTSDAAQPTDGQVPADARTADAVPPGDGGPGDGGPGDGGRPDAEAPDATSPDAGPPPRPLILNEVDCTGERWFELYNPSPDGREIADWVVSFGEGAAERRWTIPLGYFIGAGRHLAFPGAREMAERTTFDLACGEVIRLWQPDGVLADEIIPQGVRPNGTWGRLPDGGPWQATGYTRAAPNAPLPPPAEVLFNPDHIPTLDVAISAADRARLDAEPRTPVPATLTFTAPDEDEADAAVPIQVAIGGAAGAFRSLNGKASFLIDFEDAGGLFGVTQLELDARTADRALLTRWLTLNLYQLAGVPAPRAGLAWLRVDLGEGPRVFGLYLTVESYDAATIERALGPTAQLFQVGGGLDFTRGVEHQARAIYGDGADLTAFERLVSLIGRVRPASLYALTSDRLDWAGAIALLAAEAVGGMRDGYQFDRLDWTLQLDPAGVGHVLPGRSERALADVGSLHQGSSLLFGACLLDAACEAQYDRAIGRVLAATASLPARLRALNTRIAPWVERDPRRPYSARVVNEQLGQMATALEDRLADVTRRMACRLGDNADPDQDGYLCEDDCAPNNPAQHPGVPDVCGDGVDQDCSGVADDAVGCLDCVEVRRGPRPYLICRTPRPFAQSLLQCEAFGATAATVDAEGEAVWMDAAVTQAGAAAYWTGLNDRFATGTFTWAWDGLEPAAPRWAMDEPVAAAGARCARADAAAGTWSTVPCEQALAIVCEPPCPVAEDLDGDGATGCGIDCNDGDPAVHPGADERCGDGRDQDCDGLTDEGCGG